MLRVGGDHREDGLERVVDGREHLQLISGIRLEGPSRSELQHPEPPAAFSSFSFLKALNFMTGASGCRMLCLPEGR